MLYKLLSELQQQKIDRQRLEEQIQNLRDRLVKLTSSISETRQGGGATLDDKLSKIQRLETQLEELNKEISINQKSVDRLVAVFERFNDLDKKIYTKYKQGRTTEQLSIEYRCSQRTIQRIIQKVDKELQDRV